MKRIGIAALLLTSSLVFAGDEFFWFPKYPGAEVSEQESYGSMHNLTLRTKDDLVKVTTFYKTAHYIEWCKEISDTHSQCRFVNKDYKGIVGIDRKSYGVTVIEASVMN